MSYLLRKNEEVVKRNGKLIKVKAREPKAVQAPSRSDSGDCGNEYYDRVEGEEEARISFVKRNGKLIKVRAREPKAVQDRSRSDSGDCGNEYYDRVEGKEEEGISNEIPYQPHQSRKHLSTKERQPPSDPRRVRTPAKAGLGTTSKKTRGGGSTTRTNPPHDHQQVGQPSKPSLRPTNHQTSDSNHQKSGSNFSKARTQPPYDLQQGAHPYEPRIGRPDPCAMPQQQQQQQQAPYGRTVYASAEAGQRLQSGEAMRAGEVPEDGISPYHDEDQDGDASTDLSGDDEVEENVAPGNSQPRNEFIASWTRDISQEVAEDMQRVHGSRHGVEAPYGNGHDGRSTVSATSQRRRGPPPEGAPGMHPPTGQGRAPSSVGRSQRASQPPAQQRKPPSNFTPQGKR